MTMEELAAVCQEAARDLAARHPRPLPAAVVLPLPGATRITTLPDFPEEDHARAELLAGFAAAHMVPVSVPCYGFIAEATLAASEDPVDVVVAVWGARRHRPQVAVAPVEGGTLGAFSPPEELDPAAMPFLHPLQHAADAT